MTDFLFLFGFIIVVVSGRQTTYNSFQIYFTFTRRRQIYFSHVEQNDSTYLCRRMTRFPKIIIYSDMTKWQYTIKIQSRLKLLMTVKEMTWHYMGFLIICAMINLSEELRCLITLVFSYRLQNDPHIPCFLEKMLGHNFYKRKRKTSDTKRDKWSKPVMSVI